MCDKTFASQWQVRPSYLRCNSDSPTCVAISSPVSDLTSNLQVLSTTNSDECLARRRLSLDASVLDSSLSSMCSSKYSSVSSLCHDHEKVKDTPSPANWLHRHSTDDGFVESPDSVVESPFLQMNTSSIGTFKKFHSSSCKKSVSMPITFCGFDSTSPGNQSVSPSCGSKDVECVGGRQQDKENCLFPKFKKLQDNRIAVTNRHALSDETNNLCITYKARPVLGRQLSVPIMHHSYSSQSLMYCPSQQQPDDDVFSKVESRQDAEFLPDLRSPCSTGQFSMSFPRHLSSLFFSPVLEANDENDDGPQSNVKRGLPRSPSAPATAADRQAPGYQGAKYLVRRRSSVKRLESERDRVPDAEPVETKRHRTNDTSDSEVSPAAAVDCRMNKATNVAMRRPFVRCHSETELIIKSALQRADTHPDLIGDFSRPYCLPLVCNSKHPDLKSITVDTMARLLRNEWKDTVSTFTVLDCRYPYEFEGGHIQGAKNFFTQEDVLNEFFSSSSMLHVRHDADVNKRNILIFHCEFSSERGPNLSRFLRRKDRDANRDCYPKLYYPELYLLEGGFKLFYETNSELCFPCGYLPMLHEAYSTELKHFRSKSLSWNNDKARLPSSTANHRVSLKL